jgi:hypothetical protein
MVKTIEKTMYLLSIIFFIWLAISYIEILRNNVYPGSMYSNYNLIIIALKYFN